MDETWKHNAKARHKIHILYEISRTAKSIEAESRLGAVRGGGWDKVESDC